MKLYVNALGDTCPIPVVKTKKAVAELKGSGVVEVLVDNEIAVQNLTKMADQKGYAVHSEKLETGKYQVVLTVGEAEEAFRPEEVPVCIPDGRRDTLVVVSSDRMGTGNDELGRVLMKGFIYALTQQDTLPSAVLFYNGGAKLTSEDSPIVEDLKSLEAQGVEILTCGTCLDYLGRAGDLKVGSVTNMYTIVEKLTQAGKVIKP